MAPLAERLRARGLRLTAQRTQVLAAVTELEHATPDAIGARLREEAGPGGAAPDASTVYRNLELLERLGLVWHTHLGKGAPVYHAAEHPHLHVVCQTRPSRSSSSRFRYTVEASGAVPTGPASSRRRAPIDSGVAWSSAVTAASTRCRCAVSRSPRARSRSASGASCGVAWSCPMRRAYAGRAAGWGRD